MSEAPVVGSTPAGHGAASTLVDEPLLRVEGLQKYFPIRQGVIRQKVVGHVQAIDGVDLVLHRGETLGLVGESGCGKSTLAKMILGLEKPTGGRVLYRGEEVAAMDARQLRAYRRRVQIVFQDPYTSLNPRMTVGDIVAEPWAIHRDVAPKGGRAAATRDLLVRVGLDPDAANRYPHQFSGGQRQRIGIARALALRPEVIVCDEPVSALDVSVQAQVVNLLEELRRDFALSYLFIAHDLSVVRHISDRVAVMYLGRVVETGATPEVYDSPVHPYTQALLSAVPVHDPELRGRRKRIMLVGDVPDPSDPPSGCRFRTRCFKVQPQCSIDDPELYDRGQGHPSACHFAAAVPVAPTPGQW